MKNPVALEFYQTSDGKIFECPDKASEHQKDVIGELLDGFLPHDDRANVTMSDRYNILIKQLNDPELVSKINQLYQAVNHWS